MKIAEKIISIMKEKGITAEYMSSYTGLTIFEISSWEQGYKPNREELEDIAECLNVPVNSLGDYDKDNSPAVSTIIKSVDSSESIFDDPNVIDPSDLLVLDNYCDDGDRLSFKRKTIDTVMNRLEICKKENALDNVGIEIDCDAITNKLKSRDFLKELTLYDLYHICRYLEVSADYLMGLDFKEPTDMNFDDKLIETYKNLSFEDKLEVATLVSNLIE